VVERKNKKTNRKTGHLLKGLFAVDFFARVKD
jgi:hypothetical protein